MIDWVVRAAGVFWFVGGLATARALAQSRVVDLVLASLDGGTRRRDRVRTALLGGGAILTTASGAALIGLDRLAPGLMIVNALLQAAWLLFAARAFPPEDEADRIGRRRSRNAFLVWTVATVAIVALALRGDVVFSAQPWFEAAIAVAALIGAGLVARAVSKPVLGGMAAFGEEVDDEAGDDEDLVTQPRRAPIDPSLRRRLMFGPNLMTPSLLDVDSGEVFDPSEIDLPDDLREELGAFEIELQEYLVTSRTDPDLWVLPAEVRAGLEPRIAALAQALAPFARDGAATWWLPPAEETTETP